MDPDVLRLEDARAVDAYSMWACGVRTYHHVDQAVAFSRRCHAPERGGRAVAERGAVADGQQRCGLVTKLGRCVVSDGEDASMEGVELAAGREPVRGRIADADHP